MFTGGLDFTHKYIMQIFLEDIENEEDDEEGVVVGYYQRETHMHAMTRDNRNNLLGDGYEVEDD